MHTPRIVTLAKLTTVLGLTLATVRCQPDRAAAPTGLHAPRAAAQAASVRERSHLRYARQDMAWVGDLHTRVMQEWMSGRATMRGLPGAEACASLARIIRSYLPQAQRATGVRDDDVFERALADAQWRAGCAGQEAPPLGRMVVAHLYDSVLTDTGVVTGAYEPYATMLQKLTVDAMSPEDVVEAVDLVLMRARTIPSPDFDVLSAIGYLAASSATYWGDTGSGGSAMAIFRRTFSWRNFAGADIGGAIATVGFLRTIGAVHPYLIAGGLFGGAAVASGYYAYQNS